MEQRQNYTAPRTKEAKPNSCYYLLSARGALMKANFCCWWAKKRKEFLLPHQLIEKQSFPCCVLPPGDAVVPADSLHAQSQVSGRVLNIKRCGSMDSEQQHIVLRLVSRHLSRGLLNSHAGESCCCCQCGTRPLSSNQTISWAFKKKSLENMT